MVENNKDSVLFLLFIPFSSFIFYTLFCLIKFDNPFIGKWFIMIVMLYISFLLLKFPWKRKLYINQHQIKIVQYPLKKIEIIELYYKKEIKIVTNVLEKEKIPILGRETIEIFSEENQGRIYTMQILLEKKEYSICSSLYYEELYEIKEKLLMYWEEA